MYHTQTIFDKLRCFTVYLRRSRPYYVKAKDLPKYILFGITHLGWKTWACAPVGLICYKDDANTRIDCLSIRKMELVGYLCKPKF